jgi:hypothetical protein
VNTSSFSTDANSEPHPNATDTAPAASRPSSENESPPQASAPPGNSEEGPKHHHRRTGKIARLSRELRDQVNQNLSDGLPFADILASLGDHGLGITEANLGNWKAGGYQDWLKEQQLLEECRTRHELTLQFARENRGIEGIQAAHNVTVELLCQAVAEYGPEALKEAFDKNPLNVLRAFTALARLSSAGLKFHKHQSEEDRAARQAQNQTDGKKGISPEVLKEMIRELNLM